MRRSLQRILYFLPFVVWTAGSPAVAQTARVQVVDSRPDGLTLAFEATWSATLQMNLDSLGAAAATPAVLFALSAADLRISETVVLPSPALPRVALTGSDYDEITLPAAPNQRDSLAAWGGEPVAAGGLGTYRKRPAASVEAAFLRYDPASGTLRRYRRLVVNVSYAGQGTQTAFRTTASRSTNPHLAVDVSVLAEGTTFKIPIREEGVYRIGREYLAELGLNPDQVEPNNLRVFGNGGAPLPALNSDPRPADLIENPVIVRGGGDGAFNENDALFFYGAPPAGWRYQPIVDEVAGTVIEGDSAWTHYVHPFSNTNAYFLQISTEEGARIETAAFPNAPEAVQLNTVTGRHVRDIDEYIWSKQGGTGHTWISTPILAGGRLRIFENVNLPGFAGGTVRYLARVAINSNPAAAAYLDSGEQRLAEIRTGNIGSRAEDEIARAGEVGFTQNLAAGMPLDLTMTLQALNNEPRASLDWIRVFYDQSLRATEDLLRFATPGGVSGTLEFVLEGFSAAPIVLDVTEPGTIHAVEAVQNGSGYRIQVRVDDPDRPHELIAYTENATRILEAPAEPVPPQNLHGVQQFPEFVIVTPAVFKAYADELAGRREQEGMSVLVTVIDEIYNEFSGGMQDMRAVRDYFKFLYDRDPAADPIFEYALLMGDGHYNFRELGTEPVDFENWIPPYETEDTFDPDQTYTSDDYFGLLDDEEGAWTWPGTQGVTPPRGGPIERVDIGVGRFTAQTEADVRAILDKIARYEDPETYGSWRSRYTFIADDAFNGLLGQEDDNDLHVQNADVVSELVQEEYPAMNIKKIYGLSYPRVFLNGYRLPEAKRDILNTIRSGTLFVNYSGHGGEEALAQEEILTKEDALDLDNRDRLPIFITATCSFGWWDFARVQSGAEELLLNPNGGAVALLTTVRLVYTSAVTTTLNVGLNRELNRQIFTFDETGRPKRLGEVLRITKNSQVGLQGNNRKFNLLGDPTLRVGLPAGQVAVRSINGVDITAQQGQMRALDRITIEGDVLRGDGALDATFSGPVEVTVYDASRRVPIEPADLEKMTNPYYTVREDLIWRGGAEARDGRFSATFVVPKDISYSNQSGRVSVYAWNAGAHALGDTENFLVGGTSPNPPDDAVGPQISLFLNDTTFVSGGLTVTEPTLIARLYDESGINIVGAGVGHEMLMVLNGNEQEAVNISEGFRSVENSYQRGLVNWDLPEQEPGAHRLSVRVWDVLNNSSTAELDYVVAAAEDLVLENVFNYPNPTTGATRFVFEHNQPLGTNARIQVRIYTLTGRLIRTLESEEVLPGGPVQVAWNGLDEDFDPLSTGVYLYKLRVEVDRPEGGRHISEKIEKLAVIR